MKRAVSAAMAVACLWGTVGCNAARGRPIDLGAYHAVVSDAIFAWGWGGAAGYQDKDEFPIRVLFRRDSEVANYRLVMCDPAASPCELLAEFGDLDLAPRQAAGGLFGEFRTKVSKRNVRLVVIAERGDELLASPQIAATADSRPTSYAAGALVFDRHDQELSWPRVPAASLFIVTLADQEAPERAVSVATRRKRWMYPELVGVEQYFHDPAQVPELERGHTYGVVLYAVNEAHWATLITDRPIQP